MIFFWWLPIINAQEGLRILIMSEDMPRERNAADALRKSLVSQGAQESDIHFLHKNKGDGNWYILNWIRKINLNEAKWSLVVPVDVEINLAKIKEVQKMDGDYFGHKLVDEGHLIIHHYDNDTSYPKARSGFLISPKIGILLEKNYKKDQKKWTKVDFVITPNHEFAKFLSKQLSIELTDVKMWEKECVKYKYFPGERRALKDKLFVAVKTTAKYREKRVENFIKKSWGTDSRVDVRYFTDEDSDLENSINVKVNSESGHCGKMTAIFRYLIENEMKREFILISDDDALYNVDNLIELVEQQDPDVVTYLGERYAYANLIGNGYDYITTGGGLIITRGTLEEYKKCFSQGSCSCSKNDSPDDMTLGMWNGGMNIQATHSSQFHQRKPEDYHTETLDKRPISFHSVLWSNRDWKKDIKHMYLKTPYSASKDEL